MGGRGVRVLQGELSFSLLLFSPLQIFALVPIKTLKV